jgi:predicted phage terminase large subunit-like protein
MSKKEVELMREVVPEEQKMYFDSLAELDYEFYTEYVNEGYRHGEHTEYICKKLQEAIEQKGAKRLIVTMPPQHSKSFTITETFPSFFLGRNPTKNVIGVGYSDDFAEKFGRRNKEKIKDFGAEIFDAHLSSKQAHKDWELEKGGGMISSGVGGQITGKRADLMIIDDPIKNRKEANSKRYRDTLWEEWESTLSTRLAEDAIVILVLTRWHEDDLAGRFLERFGDDWELLNFPALSEGKDTDLLSRPEDTALWEDQYSTEYLKKRRKELSAKAWNSLYMGSPNIEEGNQFKSTYFRYFRENDDRNAFILERPEGKKVILKEKCVCFQTVDSSFKVKTRNDYTVISTWYLTPNNDLLLYDVYRDKIPVPDLWSTLDNVMDRFNPSKVFVEDRASGTGLIQTAKREGRPVIPIPAESDKITRSFNISTFYENRAVYHKAETNWVADFEDELNTFPEGTNDDQVDTASIAGIVVSRGMIRASNSNRGFVHTT